MSNSQITNVLPTMTWGIVNFVRSAVAWAPKPFPRRQWGWLYPDGSSIKKRIWIKVPVIGKRPDGTGLAYSIAHLDTTLWMDCGRESAQPYEDSADLAICIDKFPFDDHDNLDHFFTIIVTSQRTTGPVVHPVNDMINRMVPDLPRPWRGNVLVFKHGKRRMHPIINISPEDGTFVAVLIKRVPRDGLVGNEDLGGQA
ncbi:hypothetical protein B0H17DRAFT_1200656 [Mycena rosella]|uniref:Uncharacterized protein n=1 Tax=Mycena rosella TaxID=1033263 RepID=A0AAD7GFE7_MYCRO|nr:hypothetical protein B0H17DRAFT_1200656 [Mycena rosella]